MKKIITAIAFTLISTSAMADKVAVDMYTTINGNVNNKTMVVSDTTCEAVMDEISSSTERSLNAYGLTKLYGDVDNFTFGFKSTGSVVGTFKAFCHVVGQ